MESIMANFYIKKRSDDLWKELLLDGPEEALAETQTKPARGGKRDGAGRPKGSTTILPENLRIRFSVRLPRWMVNRLNRQDETAGRFIETVLNDYWLRKLER